MKKANDGINLNLCELGIHGGFDRFELFAAEMTRAFDPLAMHNLITHLGQANRKHSAYSVPETKNTAPRRLHAAVEEVGGD